jgi:hypothetical protein
MHVSDLRLTAQLSDDIGGNARSLRYMKSNRAENNHRMFFTGFLLRQAQRRFAVAF